MLAEATVIGFVPVTDFDADEAFYCGAPGAGSWVEQDERGIWTAPDGTLVFRFHDPFGNTLSLSRHRAVTNA